MKQLQLCLLGGLTMLLAGVADSGNVPVTDDYASPVLDWWGGFRRYSGPRQFESAIQRVEENQKFVPTGELRARKSFRNYVVKIYGHGYGIYDDGGSVEITRNGTRVFAGHSGRIEIACVDGGEGDTCTTTLIGRDVTGDGIPDLVLTGYSGGMHCCHSLDFFELGSQFRHIQSVYSDDAHFSRFVNLDADPALEIEVDDASYAYGRVWTGPIFNPIILKFQNGQYRMAGNLMRKPPMTRRELETLADSARAYSYLEDGLRHDMLSLIYTGNARQAWELCALTWPPDVAGRQAFLTTFVTNLPKGRYWRELLEMNGREAMREAIGWLPGEEDIPPSLRE
ncbi:MAG TPA: hypothetical protein PLT86_08030 [Candidatus Latescibacteria bacterium]|nr:hypothetical protein [Candidatus Latescibacterota bacterium]HQE60886.1 hypothetical protein [Candidatus Latescibacterota bacterium]HQI76343.1 hypothetical protein [Candidatus Latescibacterota bacterium]HQK22404.1 hypothetical protein [Candidatus Latescibacterota bacterium]HRU22814.1 hypothetical protein [Candidatus Latescibacterota bacterium]